MQLVVGLGNPGDRYVWTRHNLGFRVVEALAARTGLRFGPADAGCAAAFGAIGGREVALVKPQLFMNRSGEALAAWARARGRTLVPPDDPAAIPDPGAPPVAPAASAFPPPLAVCDDIALPLGSLRLRAAGSDGGHRGLESLARALGGNSFPRLRLGVDGLEAGVPPSDWADYVLAEFPAAEREASAALVQDACDAVLTWLERGVAAAASGHNRRGGRV